MEQTDDELETLADQNLTLTENGSHAYGTTSSACLDFHFSAMQNAPEETLVRLLKSSWEENSILTLKLVCQLRDIRHGKGAMIEFHHCLIWLFHHHPKTLIHNLEFISMHGYWKDLSWLIKFLLEDKVAVNTAKPTRARTKECSEQDYPLETLIRKRVNGEVDRQTWQRYLKGLPNNDARKEAKEKFQELAKEIHIERSQKAKEKKKKAKENASLRLAELSSGNSNFSCLYDKVVELFANALRNGKDNLNKEHTLKTEAIAAKWVPRIGGSIDKATSLGKAIARKLYRSSVGEEAVDSALDEDEADRKAFAYYRKEFVSPLRQNIKIPEKFMSANKWEEVDYERVPSVCMKRNKKHFLKHDADRFKTYLSQVKTGNKKIASGALLPHQIVAKFMEHSQEEPELEQVSELQWKSYVDSLKKSGTLESALSVCDVSGSMAGEPMQVAIALSILTSEVSAPPFNGLICTFSNEPKLQVVNHKTLREKVSFTRQMDWTQNTNLQVSYILNTKP